MTDDDVTTGEFREDDRTDDEEPPTIRESIRASAEPLHRLGVAVSTWLAISIPVNGVVQTLDGVLGVGGPIVYPFGSLGLSICATAAILRYRPDATDGIWAFALSSFAAFLVVGFVAVPGFDDGAGLYGSPWVVLDLALAWTAALLVGYVVAYRGGWAAIRGGTTG